MKLVELLEALDDTELFKHKIPDISTFKQTAVKFPEKTEALFEKLLTTKGEFDRLIKKPLDFFTLYREDIDGNDGIDYKYFAYVLAKMKSSDEIREKIISDISIFFLFIQSYCPPDEQEYFYNKFLTPTEFKRLISTPIAGHEEGSDPSKGKIGAWYFVEDKRYSPLISRLQTLPPENSTILMEAILSDKEAFKTAFENSGELIAMISEFPNYKTQLIESVLDFDIFSGNEEGWNAIKPYCAIETIRTAPNFSEARIQKQIHDRDNMRSVLEQGFGGKAPGLPESLATTFTGTAAIFREELKKSREGEKEKGSDDTPRNVHS